MASNPQFLTTQEVAEIARVSPLTVSRWARTKQLRGRRVGRAWRFLPADVDTFLELDQEAS